MLITNQVVVCKCCNKHLRLSSLGFGEIMELIKINYDVTNKTFVEYVKNDLERKHSELMETTRENNEYTVQFDNFIKNDYKLIFAFIKECFAKGYGTNPDSFWVMETSPRDTSVDYMLEFLANNGNFCSKKCIAEANKPKVEKVDRRTLVDIERIYAVTERRLGEKAIAKMFNKLHLVQTKGKLNHLVENKNLGMNIPMIIVNNKPYHIACPTENNDTLHITPYCVWITDKNKNNTVLYNNIYEQYKGSMTKIKEMGAKHKHSDIFEVAFLLYEGRKSADILMKKVNGEL